jgi:phospholipase C
MSEKDPDSDCVTDGQGLLSRRRTLQGLSSVVGAAVIGCGNDTPSGGETGETSSGESGDGDGDPGDGDGDPGDGDGDGEPGDGDGDGDGEPGDGDGDGDPVDPCTNDAGLSVPEALANVEHIIVLCMENRSFDHFFGARQLVEGQSDIAGLTGSESNPDGLGNEIVVAKLDNYEPADPPHQWEEVHAQWNEGALDGFVTQQIAVNGESLAHEVMGYHTRADIPILYALADEYTLCDHWHCSLLGGTWPNRYYLHAATSNGRTSNAPALPLPTTIQDVLDDAGISNNNYYGDVPWKWGAFPVVGFAGTDSFDEFFMRLDEGTLEQVVIIDPSFTSNDDHPSHSIELGQALINTIYQALAQSQYWEKCLLIITYDEHGGFYDHVAPPLTPDANGPEYARQGFRVPALVIGPHVRKGCVVHEIFDHASFAATVTRKFGLPELNERAAGVKDLAICIDPSTIDNPQPPAPLPKVVIDLDTVMARVGVETSQEELMRATGNWPITPEFTAAERGRIRRLLEHGVRLGAVELRTQTAAG